MSIGSNIKAIREAHGLTQEELGKIAGVTDKAVSTWENGTKTPRMGAIQKIADHFGMQKSEIIDDNLTSDSINEDAELTEYLEELRTRPELRMIFSLTKNATKKDVEKAVKVIEAMLSEGDND